MEHTQVCISYDLITCPNLCYLILKPLESYSWPQAVQSDSSPLAWDSEGPGAPHMSSVPEKAEVNWEIEQEPPGGNDCTEVLLVSNFGGCDFTSSTVIPLQMIQFQVIFLLLSFQVIKLHCNHHLQHDTF